MPGTLAAAFILVLASVVVGRALMLALGWRRPEWVAGAVGFAALVTAAPFAVRLPGRGLTAAIILALAVVACAAVTRRAVPRREPGVRPPEDAPRHQHRVALVVVVATLALACLPFVFNERTGVLGEGIYTNDQAAQLYWADWLANGFGPQPTAVSFGYPVGPQALAASVSEGTGINLVDAFNGLLIAIPALTALAALSLLVNLAPWRRGLAAVLAGLPFLGASFLAQSGFKETAMAMFVVALAVVLHVAVRRAGEDMSPPPARAPIGVVAVLAAASVFTFSIPGGVWFGVAVPVWAILTWGFGTGRIDSERLRADASEHRKVLIGGAVALLALAAIALGPAGGFLDKIDEVQGSSGRLSSPVFPGEAFGIWPEGDFRIVRGEVSGSLLASGFAALCTLGATIALVRRREWGILAALVGAGFVYAVARPFAQIHVEAKALAVLAPIAMLVTIRWLLAPGRSSGSIARQAVGAVFCALALASTFIALRAAPVGFNERGSEDLRALAERVDGGSVVFLGVDRFAGYWLRGTLAESPGGYVPQDVDARPEKTWQQGLAMDFDTLSPSKLDNYDYAVTTAAAYASTPPESFAEIAREGDYVLWERAGETPPQRVLPEEGDPGLKLDCSASQPVEDAEATTLATPPTADFEDWSVAFPFEAPGSATVTLDVPAGDWQVSLQYHSQAPLTVSVDGQEVAELPPSLEGFYLVGAGRGAFWPAGEISSAGGIVEVEVESAEPSGLQDFLGAERQTWLGTVALTSTEGPSHAGLSQSCGKYVDHYEVDR
ncbi:MAG: hypothetical protein M3355_03440 [Actinomycetota bacterium]|nr:hypothetical protein [Actinomycetota bacterium]